MDAVTLRGLLKISSGSLSMALKDLLKLGLVYRETGETQRRFYYSAETDIWRVITRLFREHERNRLKTLLTRVEEAEALLQTHVRKYGHDEVGRFQLEQVRHLVGVGQFIIDLLDAFMERTKVELKAAKKFLSVSGRLGGEPFSRLRRAINASRDEKRRIR